MAGFGLVTSRGAGRFLKGSCEGSFTPESLSRDFRELYLLRPDEFPDEDGALLAADGNEPRRTTGPQDLRKRMCAVRRLFLGWSSARRS